MKFLRKRCLMIILKVTEKQGFTPSLERTALGKPQVGVKLIPAPPTPQVFKNKT